MPTISPAVATLSFAGKIPVVVSPILHIVSRPAAATLTTSGHIPTLDMGDMVVATFEAKLTMVGGGVWIDGLVRPSTGPLALTGKAPTISVVAYNQETHAVINLTVTRKTKVLFY
jgi:hypothetical protein